MYDDSLEEIKSICHETIEGGDNKHTCIAAASILAKVSRDEYIADLCEKYPELAEHYGINTNMGYGTKVHVDRHTHYGPNYACVVCHGRCNCRSHSRQLAAGYVM